MAKKPKASRGRLASMRVSAGFRDFALDQLSDVPGLRPRAMFGGVGLYADEVFFGILAADVLYFKVDDSTRNEYEAAGSSPFKPYPDRAMTMPYYSVPIQILEDAVMARQWAARAVAAAIAAKEAKASAVRKKPPATKKKASA